MLTTKQNWLNALAKPIHSVFERARWRGRSSGRHRQPEDYLLTQIAELERRVAAIQAERDAARQQLAAQQASLPGVDAHQAVRRRRLRPTHLGMTSSVLLLGALASASTLLEAPVIEPVPQPSQRLAETARQDMAREAATAAAGPLSNLSKDGVPSLHTSIRKLGRPGASNLSHRQWGPPLRLSEAGGKRIVRRSDFDPLVKQQQQDLLDLGFDLGQSSADGLKGPRTQQAIDEFRALYVSGEDTQLPDAELAFLIGVYADLARRDAERFGVERGVVAAIRLSSVRTGVDFSFLMELAAVESAFNPAAQAPGSSAAGLYQFTHDTWLNTLKSHGEKYGLGDYAAQIEYTVDRRGYRRPRIADETLYQHVLALRRNPRVSAMMAAESVKDNLMKLSSHFDHQPARTDLYLTHFFGPEGAVSFIKALNESPDRFAADVFPVAAANNSSIFHPKTCNPRTLTEVYEIFSKKFDTARYEDLSLN